MLNNRKKLYEGKAKILFEGQASGTIIQYYKDDVTAFNNAKHDVIHGKGILNNVISEFIMTRLNEASIPTHFIKRLNMREQLVKKVKVIPIEVVVRNVVAGSMVKRLGLQKGNKLGRPIIEHYYKDDALSDPMITEDHAFMLGIADTHDLSIINGLAYRINDYLLGMFAAMNLRLIDFKIEFGKHYNSHYNEEVILLADEISPDSCRLWDMSDDNITYDKDIFRENKGDLKLAYQEIAKRMGVLPGIKNDQE
jgi:phosphoribosylaminoimidazole-succinocarboxamide synthase